jgi:hypothetical protein
MGNFIYDKLNDFGYMAGPLADGAFPNIIGLGDAKADRMVVDILPDKNVAGGTSAKIIVQGCDTEGGTYAAIAERTFTLAELKKGVCSVAISPNPYKFLKVYLDATGTFTGTGGARAIINSYIGK